MSKPIKNKSEVSVLLDGMLRFLYWRKNISYSKQYWIAVFYLPFQTTKTYRLRLF
jgi:hypothetical protein